MTDDHLKPWIHDERLKCCPFCGSDPIWNNGGGNPKEHYTIQCTCPPEDGCPCPAVFVSSEEIAVDTWNKRSAGLGQWWPIETAPTDETIILGLNGVDEDGEPLQVVMSGFWQDAEEDGQDYMGADAGFVDTEFNAFWPSRSFGTLEYQYPGRQPTGWMPFPDPKEIANG